jgi:hypothetical protein
MTDSLFWSARGGGDGGSRGGFLSTTGGKMFMRLSLVWLKLAGSLVTQPVHLFFLTRKHGQSYIKMCTKSNLL